MIFLMQQILGSLAMTSQAIWKGRQQPHIIPEHTHTQHLLPMWKNAIKSSWLNGVVNVL